MSDETGNNSSGYIIMINLLLYRINLNNNIFAIYKYR